MTITKVFDGTEFKILVSYRKFIKLKPATRMPDGSFYYVYELLIPQWPLGEKKKKKKAESVLLL